jgi:hypothetical protein
MMDHIVMLAAPVSPARNRQSQRSSPRISRRTSVWSRRRSACRREAARARAAAAKLEDGRQKEKGHILSMRAEDNDDLLAHKAAQQAIMLMKQEVLNMAFN